MSLRKMIGPHVNDWTAQSVADVQKITGASVIKALAPNNSLHVYADQNPESLRIARQYIPDISMDWRQRCDLLNRYVGRSAQRRDCQRNRTSVQRRG